MAVCIVAVGSGFPDTQGLQVGTAQGVLVFVAVGADC